MQIVSAAFFASEDERIIDRGTHCRERDMSVTYMLRFLVAAPSRVAQAPAQLATKKRWLKQASVYDIPLPLCSRKGKN